ncbi:TonB-dependent receptor [Shewanella sp. PP-He15 brown]
MSRYSSMLTCLSFGLLSLSQPLQAAEYSTSKPLVMPDKSEKTANAPYIALMLDYVPAADNLYGITLAPYHFDNNYQQWGYYLGYARSRETDIIVPEPAQSFRQESLFRLGLSYSLTADLSFYAGGSGYISTVSYTNNISPKIVDGKPTWEEDKTTRWGAEAGLRYRITEHFILSAGYNSSTESTVLSIGYAG